ncbi:unnamed protein product [Phytophthora lilii]|uniref:RxLR effector protein n=1 Tax=Phytophthora lilii TaxID=2077276 RepID=A0A9W6TXK5_9STRA|nr:unnamed protein product [Phytophthora lilii]
MRLHYIFLATMVILAAANDGVAASRVVDSAKLTSTDQIHTTNLVQPAIQSKRFLRRVETEDATPTYKHEPATQEGPVFMEHKLQKALSNPKKTQRLYQQWYNSGYTAKEVADHLKQNENRDIEPTYRKISRGYDAYVKQRRSKKSQTQL